MYIYIKTMLTYVYIYTNYVYDIFYIYIYYMYYIYICILFAQQLRWRPLWRHSEMKAI